MSFSLGWKSQTELTGVHPALVRVVKRAIQLTPVDFGVHDGLRTKAQQAALFAARATRTMNSKHLPQADGWGHAVDLVPYINGVLRWEWGPIYQIAAAVRMAANEFDTTIVWGGVWDRALNDLDGDLSAQVRAYNARHPGDDFNDGPHFQLG